MQYVTLALKYLVYARLIAHSLHQLATLLKASDEIFRLCRKISQYILLYTKLYILQLSWFSLAVAQTLKAVSFGF
jgi:hypothetical protein